MATQQDAAAAAELIGMLKLASFDRLQKKTYQLPKLLKEPDALLLRLLAAAAVVSGTGRMHSSRSSQTPHTTSRRSGAGALPFTQRCSQLTTRSLLITALRCLSSIPEYDPSCALKSLLPFPCDEAKRLFDNRS
jgi:hypothetical protein